MERDLHVKPGVMKTEAVNLRAIVERESRNLAHTQARLERALEKNAPLGRSLGMVIGERTLTLDTEVVAFAIDVVAHDPEAADALVRALAWQMKALRDLNPPSGGQRVHGASFGEDDVRLLFDLGTGSSIEAELDDIVARPRQSLGTRWMDVLLGVRHRVRLLVAEVREAVAESKLDYLDQVQSLIASAGAEAGPLTRVERAHPRAWHQSKVVIALSVTLLVALIAHFSVNGVDWLRPDPAAVFAVEDFSVLPAVIEIEDCPPSVLLTVREAEWVRMDRGARLELLERSRSIVSGHAYTGVLVSTEHGSVVAQWATHSGDVLFESGSTSP